MTEYSYTFKYNPFGNALVAIMIGIATLPLAFCSMLTILAVIIAVAVLSYILCQRTYLTIDSHGITKSPLLCGTEFVEWSDVGRFSMGVSRGSGRVKMEGIGVVRKSKAKMSERYEYDSEIHAMFIPLDYICAPNKDVEKALNNCLEAYVKRRPPKKDKNANLAGWADPNATQRKTRIVLWLFYGAWLLFFVYVAHTCFSILMGDYGELIKRSLVDGSQYNSPSSLFLLANLVVYLLPNMVLKGNYTSSFIVLIAALTITVYEFYTEVPLVKMLYANITEPVQSEEVCVEGTVSRVHSGRHDYTEYSFSYERTRYKIEEKYLSNARRGMKADIYIIKGSKGIPVVSNIEIPAIDWSLTGRKLNTPKERMEKKQRAPDIQENKVPHGVVGHTDSLLYHFRKDDRHSQDFSCQWVEGHVVVKGRDMGKWRIYCVSREDGTEKDYTFSVSK